MKKLIALSTLALLLGGCGSNEPVQDDSSLTEMLGGDTTTQEDTDNAEPTETPYSVGPTEIPSDLIPNE